MKRRGGVSLAATLVYMYILEYRDMYFVYSYRTKVRYEEVAG